MGIVEFLNNFSMEELKECRNIASKVKNGEVEYTDVNHSWLGSKMEKGDVAFFNNLITLKTIK